MFKLVWRQLIFERGRSLFICFAIGGALAVILLLDGLMQGLLIQLENTVLNRGADLIVAQSGVSNFLGSRSLLPQLSRERIEGIEGVKEAHPMTMVQVIYSQDGVKQPIFLIVYDTAGGPVNITEGGPIRESRQIVIDESLAKLYGLAPEDPFVVAGFEFRVAGVARRAAALFTAFAFVSYDDMIDFYFDSDLVGDISNLPLLSFLLVDLDPGADGRRVAFEIEKAEEDADVFTPERLSQNDVAMGRALFGPVLGVMIVAGYLIALLVVGMIMFAAAYARLRGFGVLKALGFSNLALAKEMALESLLLTLLAVPVALFLAKLAAWIIQTQAPLYLVAVAEPAILLRTFVGALLLALLGSLLPVRLVARLDPAIVFRG